MFELIKNKLAALGVDGWELAENKTTRWEFYFIRHKLDQNRAVTTATYKVEVYKKLEGGLIGSAAGEINPTDTEADVERVLNELRERAVLVKNPEYKLTDRKIDVPGMEGSVDIRAIAADFIAAVDSVEETATEDINSYEIFVNEHRRHILNSNGVEYTSIYPSSMLEIVVNARRDGHEIELYRQFNSGTCDRAKVKADIEKSMRTGRDRLIAEPTPVLGDIDVIFSTEDACGIFDYFADNANVAMKYRHISDYEVCKPVCQWEDGDKVTIRAVASLENSSKNTPVDSEGSVIRDRDIIRDGVVCSLWGTRRYSQYLGIDDNSDVENFVVEGGSVSADELRSGDYIELVEFSDFQVDAMGGDIAGEIRLGYLHRGGKTEIITGGSVSGSMIDAAPSMKFSRELTQYNNRVIPSAVRLKKLRITGVK